MKQRPAPWNAIHDEGWTVHTTKHDAMIAATNAVGGGPIPWEEPSENTAVVFLEGTVAAIVFHDLVEDVAREHWPEVF